MAAGACHTVALTSSGRVHACGQGTFGQLGLSGEENVDKPTEVRALSDVGVVQVSASRGCGLCQREFKWGVDFGIDTASEGACMLVTRLHGRSSVVDVLAVFHAPLL